MVEKSLNGNHNLQAITKQKHNQNEEKSKAMCTKLDYGLIWFNSPWVHICMTSLKDPVPVTHATDYNHITASNFLKKSCNGQHNTREVPLTSKPHTRQMFVICFPQFIITQVIVQKALVQKTLQVPFAARGRHVNKIPLVSMRNCTCCPMHPKVTKKSSPPLRLTSCTSNTTRLRT